MNVAEWKQLPTVLHRRGAEYHLIQRGVKSLLYARTVQGLVQSYEVFQIKIRRECIINKIVMPASEIFPFDESFGLWAKCTYTKEKALLIHNQFESL